MTAALTASRRATLAPVASRRWLRSVPDRRLRPEDAGASALERAGRGDQEAFAEFYDAMAGLVHGITLKTVRSPAIAEEVTQEVFVELWRLAPRYDPSKGSPRSWAAAIAHRRAVDRVRSEEAARIRDDREGHRRPADAADVAEAVATRLDQARVAKALGRLTEAQREAVTLAYYGGHSYREVATLLDEPEGTIKTRIRDGMNKLRDMLGEYP